MAFRSTPMMRALAAGVRANVPTLLWGPPGVGKSAKITAYAQAWGRHTECVVGSVREASDYLGLATDGGDGSTTYLPPRFALKLNASKAGLLFLDELSTAAPSVQKAMLRLLQERYAGDLPLGDHVAIVAAANPPEQAADGWDLPAPVANRLMHLIWHFDAEEWMDGVLTGFENQTAYGLDEMLGDGTDADMARVTGTVSAFLRAHPALLAPAPPADDTIAGGAWPSPRSWSNAIKVLAELDPADEDAALLVVRGCVGDGAATEFFAWVATADLHDLAEVMDNPAIVGWDRERPDRLFALTSGVTALVLTRGDKTTWEKGARALTACAEGGRPDVALPGMRTVLSNQPKGVRIPENTREAFADLFHRTGQWAAN